MASPAEDPALALGAAQSISLVPWSVREGAARRAGQAASVRLRGFKAAVVPLAAKLRPRLYLVVRDKQGCVRSPPLVLRSWAATRPLVAVEGGSALFHDLAIFQGFPSEREAQCFAAGAGLPFPGGPLPAQ